MKFVNVYLGTCDCGDTLDVTTNSVPGDSVFEVRLTAERSSKDERMR